MIKHEIRDKNGGTKKSGKSIYPSTYSSWANMKTRVYNKNREGYKNYGGRGIKICNRWSDFGSFLADMGEKPKGLSLERINNDGNYEPDNCKWATFQEQTNNARSNRKLTYKGATLGVFQWSRKINIKKSTLFRRLNAGWSTEKTLETKVVA